jgi:hypothetical protein
MTRLRSCDACSRHVFVTETRCPFCQTALEPVSNSPVFNIKAGMSRAQRFTLVAAVASQALIGCSDDPKGTGIGRGSGGNTQQGTGGTAQGTGGTATAGQGGGIAQPVYGAPIDPGTGGTNAGSGGRGNTGQGGVGGGAQAVYGAPIPNDAGVSDAGDAGDDQPKDDGGRIQPVYGGAIPLYGAIPPQDDDK